MPREKRDHFKLSNNNEHLLDVFSDNCYLELGTIEYDPLTNLLNEKLVSYEDLVYFDILKKGIGSMQSNSKELIRQLPFVYFNNLVSKNKSYGLVITYGLYLRKNGYKEYFTPIILIPVNMYFEDKTIFFQMINRPFVNPFFKTNNMNVDDLVFNEKLDSIANMDKYIMNLFKNHTSNIRMENYLTFITTAKPDIKLKQDNYYLKNQAGAKLIDKYSVDCENDIYNITPIDRIQRNAVASASIGNSFALTGHQGTGKTTTLINIASDFMKNRKKVLYISNNSNTIENVYNTFRDSGLAPYVANLSRSFNKVNGKNTEISKPQVVIESVVKKEIKEKYEEVDKIAKHFTAKRKNYSLIEVMNNIIMTPKPQNVFPEKIMNGVNALYRHEFKEILGAVQKIEKLMENIKSFSNSLFINIPITHQISDADEPLKLIETIYNCFCFLNEEKMILEKNHGFAEIENYAYLKTGIKDYFNLKKSLVPISWYSEQNNDEDIHTRYYNFVRANDLFNQLSEEIAKSKKYEATINSKFDVNKIEFDVKKALSEITDKYFKADETKINIVLGDYARIEKELSKASAYCKDLDNSENDIKNILKFNLDLNDTKVIDELLECIFVLDKGHFAKCWCDYDKRYETYKRVVFIEQILDKYEDSLKIYNKYFDNSIANIDNYIKKLIKKNKDENRKYHGVLISELLSTLYYVKNHNQEIHQLKKEYISLTNVNYEYNVHISDILKEFIEKHLMISNKQVRIDLEKSFSKLTFEEIKQVIKHAKEMKKAINNVCNSYDFVKTYKIVNSVDGYLDKSNEIKGIMKYIKNVFKWQSKMNRLLKHKKDVILIDTYLELSNLQDELYAINKKINDNKEYNYIFEKLYDGENTDVALLGKIITEFKSYVNLFKDPNCLAKSFSDNYDQELSIHLTNSDEFIGKIHNHFQNYVKIFKTNISKYYYDDFKTIIKHFKLLLESREELETYLAIADQMKILLKYKLYHLNSYIFNNNHELFADRLKYSYFHHIYKNYVDENPDFLMHEDQEKLLEDIMFKEHDLFNSNISVITFENRSYRVFKTNHLKYNEYIQKNKNSKLLYLSDTKMANIFLDIDLFDLVIIDDAHMLNANEYYKVVNGKQVIISGNQVSKDLPKTSLISRIKPNNMINLKYRYSRTPLKLLMQINNLHGRFYNEKKLNHGMSIYKDNYNQIIIDKFHNEEKCKINFFTTSLAKTRDIVQNLGNSLFDRNYSVSDISKFLTNNLNMCDLSIGNIIDADYNILDLESYYQIDDEAIIESYINQIVCCGKELIILDSKNHLNDEDCSKFVIRLKKLLKYKIPHPKFVKETLVEKISTSLSSVSTKIIGIFDPLHLVVENNEKYFGIVILENPNNTDFTILNEYREFKSNDFPIIIKWLSDFVDDYDETIKSIIGVIK